MNLSSPFIRRPVMTTLVFFSIFIFGWISYQSLPVSDLPNTEMPTIEVTVSYPGASPETMANSIATPLEEQFMTVEGIDSILSSSNQGSTRIVLVFALSRNIDAAATDVQTMISAAIPNLPSGLPNPPSYRKINPSATPILYLAITNPNMTKSELFIYGNTFIGKRLSMIEGVSQVTTYGSPYATRIQVDPEKLAAKKIGIDELVQKVAEGNVDLPLGTLYGPREDYSIQVKGQLKKGEAFNDLVVKNEGGSFVRVKDIGHALDSVKEDKVFMRFINHQMNQPCLVLAVQKIGGANTVEIIQQIDKKLALIQKELPQSIAFHKVYDQSSTIQDGLNDVKLTLFIAFCLVVLIIFLFLGKPRNTLIPALAIPISISGTFAVMYLLGFSLDIVSLLALTLCIGFLVDDAVVVLENNARHLQLCKRPFEAALNGTKEISFTVLSMTLCLASAFIPMLFMGGVVGRIFREFSVTIVVAILISGFVSLTLTPMLGSRTLTPYDVKYQSFFEKLASRMTNCLLKAYTPCLAFAMRHKYSMMGLGVASILISGVLFQTIPLDFLPPGDVGFIRGWTVAKDGTSPFLMEKYQRELSEIAMENPNVEELLSIGSFINPNEGMVFIKLRPIKERAPLQKVIEELSLKYHSLPGINAYLSPIPIMNLSLGTTGQALYQYALSGMDRASLYEYAPELTRKMRENPNFTQVSTDLRLGQPQWAFEINRAKASNYNVSAKEIETFFQFAYGENKISQINGAVNIYDVIVETLPKFSKDPSVLPSLYVRSSTNDLVPLSEILDSSETAGPQTINHFNGLTSVGISFNPGINTSLGKTLKTLTDLTKDLPSQINGKVIGTADVFKASFANLSLLLMITFFFIYVVLGILYESFIHPLTVMSTLPPALLGGLLTLYLFDQTLSLYSFVGLIMLMGIVLKNGIILVDFANEARKKGKSAEEAAIEAAIIRFRPIFMTTAAAMMGAVPIALGIGGSLAETRVSLGLCVVGGLFLSQVLTLLLTPVLYASFDTLQEKMYKKITPLQ